MKKNLKKALSAVIALAVAVSMIPATFAAKLTLTDVADTASYATAVNTLVALDIINGYEDDSFKPDNLITRAETTKVVVAALNKIKVAEGMKGDTGFKDIEAKHEWATGFINAGVAEGFINGMENNTFGPDLNVTYAQIVTMLVRALGYEDYAKYMGGYPNGYLSIGNSEGITKGVSAGTNTPVTRAQVATLVYNALNTPIVATTGMTYSGTAGGFVPTIEKFDGTSGKNYKSLLTERFEGYFVEGYITDTHTSKNSLKDDEVEFSQAYGEDYVDSSFAWPAGTPRAKSATSGTFSRGQIKVGYTDAAKLNGSYVKAIVKQNDNFEWEFISVQPERNNVVTVEADLIDTDDLYQAAANQPYELYEKVPFTTPATAPTTKVYELKYFTSDTATSAVKYNLAKNKTTPSDLAVDIYVNGNKVAKNSDSDATIRSAINNYVLNNKIGTVQLVDTFQTDGYYDAIYVDWYVTSQIKSISSSGKITLANTKNLATAMGASGTSIVLDDENKDVTYHIYYNGEEISVSDLKVDDVISIACDTTKSLANSAFYNIYVSREVVEDTLKSVYDDDGILEFANAKYKLVKASEISSYIPGRGYTLYVDAFGRILTSEKTKSSDKYAIIDKFVYDQTNGIYKANLYTAEGAIKNIEIKESKTVVKDAAGASVQAGVASKDKYDVINAIGTNVYAPVPPATTASWSNATSAAYGYATGKKADVENRVVRYEVSSAGYITTIEFLSVAASSVAGTDKFNSKINAVAGVKMDAATKIIDAYTYDKNQSEKASDLAVASLSSFVDDKTYGAFAYGDKSDGAYPLVVVKTTPPAFDETTRFAVVAGSYGLNNEGNDEFYTLPVYYKGATSDAIYNLNVTDDVGNKATVSALKKGDVIVFKTNANGYAEEVYPISAWAGNLSDYNKIRDDFIKGTSYTQIPTKLATSADSWMTSNMVSADFKRDEVTIAFGVILDSTSKNLTLAKIHNDGPTAASGTYVSYTDQKKTADYVDIGLSDDTNVYMYDYNASSNNRLSVINASSIPASNFNEAYKNNDVISWDADMVSGKDMNTNRENANFAFVLVAGGEALDVLVLAAK